MMREKYLMVCELYDLITEYFLASNVSECIGERI